MASEEAGEALSEDSVTALEVTVADTDTALENEHGETVNNCFLVLQMNLHTLFKMPSVA